MFFCAYLLRLSFVHFDLKSVLNAFNRTSLFFFFIFVNFNFNFNFKMQDSDYVSDYENFGSVHMIGSGKDLDALITDLFPYYINNDVVVSPQEIIDPEDAGDNPSDEFLESEGWVSRESYNGTRVFDMILDIPHGDRHLRVSNTTKSTKAAEGWRRLTSGEVNVDQMIADRHSVDSTHPMLHVMLENGTLDMVKRLVELGADVNADCDCGTTTVMAALLSTTQRAEKLEFIINAGASVEGCDTFETTDLMRVCNLNLLDAFGNSTDAFKCFRLIMQHTNLNSIDMQCDSGFTALHCCSNDKTSARAKILLDAGANINIYNKHGKTALAMAIEYQSDVLIKFLKSRGAI